ncbi:MAG: LptA/OstA family protein [Verrucomicrobiales bacterium]|nr:LptA/OstA family protein [Verrucomicrobiales bacterium]
MGVCAIGMASGQEEGVVEKLKDKVKGVIGAESREGALGEAAEALREARDRNLGLDKLREAANSKEAMRLREQAKQAMKRRTEDEGAPALVKRATQEAVLRNVKENVSERAAALIRASAATPPPVPGGGGAFLVAQNTVTSGGEATEPGNVTVPPKAGAADSVVTEPAKEEILIKARDVAYFDANSKVAIFEGKVEVDHPGFDIFCDKLEVFFVKEEVVGEPAAPEEEGGIDEEGSEIEMVRATGREVLIHKLGANGQMQIGKCREAIYYAKTGRVEMMIWPQVQQGQYIIMAKEEGTKMIFSANGEMNATGETESRFVRDVKPE